MEIAKVDHTSGLGIFAKSKRVVTKQDWEDAKTVSREMCDWLDAENGKFSGQHARAYAMAHAQVAPIADPWMLFVVDKSLVIAEKQDKEGKQTLEKAYFEAQAIFNVDILESPDKIEKEIPKRRLIEDKDKKGEFHMEVYKAKENISNIINVPEACMSFPFRKERKMDRFYSIRVSYQYLNQKGKVKDFVGWVNGLKAHIIQHEVGHFNAQNIFHK